MMISSSNISAKTFASLMTSVVVSAKDKIQTVTSLKIKSSPLRVSMSALEKYIAGEVDGKSKYTATKCMMLSINACKQQLQLNSGLTHRRFISLSDTISDFRNKSMALNRLINSTANLTFKTITFMAHKS